MRCRKFKSRTCGAGWRNEIFDLLRVKKTPVTPYKPIYGESSIGCYQDRGRRDLPNLLRAGYGRPSRCFKLAMNKGF
jgi:hypothetical protein